MTSTPRFRARPLARLAALVAGMAAGLMTACTGQSGRPAPGPDRDVVERIGEIELVTHHRTARGGDASGFARLPVQHWSLRVQGRPFELDTFTGLWGDKPLRTAHLHAVYVIERPQATAADLLVLVGDPNNTGAFHLVTQEAGRVAAPLLCIVSGGDNDVGWVHTTPAGAAVPADEAQRMPGPRRETLRMAADGSGPQLLQLGTRCLLHVGTRRVRVLPQLPSALSPTAYGPTLLSPDGTHLVRLALQPQGQAHRPVLAVARLAELPADRIPGSVAAHEWLQSQAPAWHTVPIDRRRMRTPHLEAIDGAWVLHHWQWQRGASPGGTAAGWTLAERAELKPLPHRGWLLAGSDQYNVDGLQPGAMVDLAGHAAAALGGRVLPPEERPHGLPPIPRVEVDGIAVSLTGHSMYIAAPLNAPAGSPAANPAARQALIGKLARAVDAELATGRHDARFDFAARQP